MMNEFICGQTRPGELSFKKSHISEWVEAGKDPELEMMRVLAYSGAPVVIEAGSTVFRVTGSLMRADDQETGTRHFVWPIE